MADNQEIADGSDDFLGGQDASKIPDRIPPNCYAAGVNVSVRRGSIQPRWGYERLAIQYEDGYIVDAFQQHRTYKEIFESGKFQAAVPYFVGQYQYIILVVSGFIFAFNPRTNTLTYIPVGDGSNLNHRAKRINRSEAGKYLVLWDYPAYPVILDGLQARRADPTKLEIPVSVMGAFNQNRLFISNNGSEFTGGDPIGSLAATVNPPITFAEVLTPGSTFYGQLFQLPTAGHNEDITYMGFLQMADSSTGIGPMIIGSNRAIYSFNTQYPRNSWESTTGNVPFGSLLVYDAGIVGPRAFVNVNSDAFFVAQDGYVRSLNMSRQEQQTWARVPVSREVENWFTVWDQSLLPMSFVGYFRNKVYFSVNPFRVQAIDYETQMYIPDYAFGGLVAMELDSLTAFGQATKPVWAGLWTGVHPMEMVTIGDIAARAFVIVKDAYSVNRIYEINPDITYDTADSYVRQNRSIVYTREYDFKDPMLNKELKSIQFNFDSLQGDFKLKLSYKPSHLFKFTDWTTFEYPVPWRECCMPDGCFINGFSPQCIRDFTLGAPLADPDCDLVTGEKSNVFRKIQLKIELTGKYWEIHEIKINAISKPQPTLQTICNYPMAPVCADCSDDWSVEPFESCISSVT